MQDSSHQRSSAPQPSALLQCLSQLNADTWAQVLLLKLVEQGSAADVALTCSQLRDLCYSSRQSINLGALLDSSEPSKLKSVISGLPLHFPNCSAVSFQLDSDKSYHTMPYLLPALAQLPRLDGMSLSLEGDLRQLLACTMLYSIRAQLPGLRSLTLNTSPSESWIEAEDVHAELGGITQLTRLCLNLDTMSVDFATELAAVQHLSGLKQLQHLVVWAQWEEPTSWYYGRKWSFPPAHPFPAVPSLTRLECNICGLGALAQLSSCRSLQHVSICLARTRLSPADWASIANLTQLTELRVLNVSLSEASTEACEAFSKLTRLQVAAAAEWSQAFLPALTACARLTEISGDWAWTGGSMKHALPQVLVLEGMLTPPDSDETSQTPVFPSLRHLRTDVIVDRSQYLCGSVLSPSDLKCLSRDCRGLQELVLTAKNGTLRVHDMVDCVAAIQSMTSLHHLTCLKFTPRKDLELLALVRACCVLERASLQELHVSQGGMNLFDDGATPTAAAWMQLGRLCHLHTLAVSIASIHTYDALADEATVFLSALSGCRTVLLRLPCASFESFENAQAELRRVGWPMPTSNIGRCVLPV